MPDDFFLSVVAPLRSFHDLWFMPSLLGGLGLLFCAVGAGLLIFGVLA